MIVRKTTDDAAATSNAMLGLSGLDTASMLKAMMKPYKTSITMLSQRQQIVVWKQERYRELISKINDFKTRFFDYRNPATNIASAGAWKQFIIDNPGAEYVKVSATGETKAKTGTIEFLEMPTGSKLTGHSDLAKEVVTTFPPEWVSAIGNYLTINMDGIVRSIEITPTIAFQDSDEIRLEKLQAAFHDAFGVGSFELYLTPATTTSSIGGTNLLGVRATSKVNQFTIMDNGIATARTELGFTGNLSNKVVMTDTLRALNDRLVAPMNFVNKLTYDSNGAQVMRNVVEFTINGVKFQFNEMNTIGNVIETVNRSEAGVTMAYDNVNDQFTFTANICGPGKTLSLQENETGFFNAIGLGAGAGGTPITGAGTAGGPVVLSELLGNVNDAILNSLPYKFTIEVNGEEQEITLNGYGAPPPSYANVDTLLNDINAQIYLKFGATQLYLDYDPTYYSATEGAFIFYVSDFPPYSATPITSLKLTADPSTDTLENFGFANMNANQGPTYTEGKFGRVIIDGVVLQVDRPVFEYDGVLYELKKLPPPGSDPIEYTISADADKIVALVREFVEAYNDLMRSLGTALSEKRDNDYGPLSDEQRDKLSEKEIEKWEAKAKLGLLRGDVHFISLSTKIRTSLFNPVHISFGSGETVAYSLKKMGIDTKDALSGFNPSDNGALYIDEEVLRRAIETNLDEIALLFTKAPQKFAPGPEDDGKPAAWNARMQRAYDDYTGGIATKFINIFDDYVRTMRGVNNAKGILIERAGVENDTSDLYNLFTKEILEYDKKISDLWDRYDRIEKEKIRVLSRLETVVSNAASQVQWMQGQTGQSQ